MTTSSATDGWTHCTRCGFRNRFGDNFCGGCQLPIRTAPPEPTPADGTTRYLCAAAQLDRRFGDGVIAEHLVEQVRAMPPSPGLDAASVLREAVAARSRRRIRDLVLLVLLLILAVTNLALLIVWLVVALVVRGATAEASGRRRTLIVGVVAVALLLASVLLPGIFGSVLLVPYYALGGLAGGGGATLPTVLLLVLVAAIVTADAVIVHLLVHERFRRDRFLPDGSAAGGWEATIRGLGLRAFWPELERARAADHMGGPGPDHATVTVHRGFGPFVGAGVSLPPRTVALPLEAAGDTVPRPIGVLELHQYVADALAALRRPSSLGPGDRLRHLIDTERVLVPADRLVTNPQALPGVLDDLHFPPAQRMPLDQARRLAENPLEWARYYRCFEIESWDRDLTTSCWFSAGTDQGLLYLEWTHCVLPPIREHYRRIDHVVEFGAGPLSRAMVDLLRLPATLPSRFAAATHRFIPLRQRDREIVPERYGASRSIRELAADDDIQSYFQGVDVLRYVNIMNTMLFRAVGQYLEDHGYSVVEFQKVASATITHNSVAVSGGTFIGNTIGSGTVTGGGSTRTGSVGGT